MPALALIVSLDTKADEARYLRDQIVAAGVGVTVVDFGTGAPGFAADVAANEIAALGGGSLAQLASERDRASAIDTMMRGVAAWAAKAYADGDLAGVIAVGGSGGTAVGTAAMRALPFGVPKVMVSTVAASDVRSYVGTKDITMINSVVDFAGLNPISEPVLRNAAAAVAAMARARASRGAQPTQRLIAATQFGVTTPAVAHARTLLGEAGYTLVPFHATGIGGQTMESLIDDGLFEAVLDLTTTEWADEVAGGNLSAGPDRLGAAARAGIPQVIAPGALDMANFFGVPVPECHAGRLLHQHNANVALMRTTPAENAEIGRHIAAHLNRATGPVVILFPLRGLSALDVEGQPFFDPAADQALLEALRQHLVPTVRLVALDLHINDPAFAEAAVAELLSLLEQHKKSDMPKTTAQEKDFPSWSETQNYGISHLKVGAEVEHHFHDCHEYWIIISGEGDAMSEGKPYHLGPGDMLLTKAGDYHSLKVTKEMVAVYYYGVMPEHGRWGHLHDGEDLPWDQYLASLKAKA